MQLRPEMRRSRFIATSVVVLLLSTIPSWSRPEPRSAARATCPSAKVLNTKGYRLHKQKEYAQAARKFRSAIDANPRYAVAHYNLACTLALLRRQGEPCEHGADIHTIIGHLGKAIALDPKRRRRMQQDPDLSEIRDTLEYHLLWAGPSVDTETGRRRLLCRFVWTGPNGETTLHRLEFNIDGTFLLRTLKVEYGEFEVILRTKEVSKRKGRYQLKKNKVHLTFGKTRKKPRRLVGTLDTPQIAFPDGLGTFTVRQDHDDDCST